MEYLVKYLTDRATTRPVDPDTDVVGVSGILMGGNLFDGSTTVRQVQLQAEVDSLTEMIDTVSGGSESGLAYVSGAIDSVNNAFLLYQNSSSLAIAEIQANEAANYRIQQLMAQDLMELISDTPVEEEFVAEALQITFQSPTMRWSPLNEVPDLKVFRNGIYLSNAAVGVSGGDYAKTSTNEIDFQFNLTDGDRIRLRMERQILASTPQPNFRHYVTGTPGKAVLIPEGKRYQVGDGHLLAFRNGLYLYRSETAMDAVFRFAETSPRFITTETLLDNDDVVEVLNFESRPSGSYRQFNQGPVTAISVPTYMPGSGHLLVWRNGLLLNTQFGDAIDRYTESSSIQVTLGQIALSGEWIAFEHIPDIQWREDVTGESGSTLLFPSPVNDPSKLLLFRNGVLMFNSTDLGIPADRYQMSGPTGAVLELAAEASDIFSMIYLG